MPVWNSGTLRLSSSALIWPADGRLAQVQRLAGMGKAAASATAWKTRNLSQFHRHPLAFRGPCPAVPPRALIIGGLCRRCVFIRGEKLFGFERGPAPETRRRGRLAVNLVLDIAGGEHARDLGRRRIGRVRM